MPSACPVAVTVGARARAERNILPPLVTSAESPKASSLECDSVLRPWATGMATRPALEARAVASRPSWVDEAPDGSSPGVTLRLPSAANRARAPTRTAWSTVTVDVA